MSEYLGKHLIIDVWTKKDLNSLSSLLDLLRHMAEATAMLGGQHLTQAQEWIEKTLEPTRLDKRIFQRGYVQSKHDTQALLT